MSTDLEGLKEKKHLDETDFSSGYDTQYEQEYGSQRPKVIVAPPDPKNMWYRDLNSILLLGFLVSVLVCGSIALIMKAFVSSVWLAFGIFGAYVVLALCFIFVEVKSIHAR